MSCCYPARRGQFTCCNGRQMNPGGTCGGEVPGSCREQGIIHQVMLDFCQRKHRRDFMQDVYGKCGGRAPMGCCGGSQQSETEGGMVCCRGPKRPRLRLSCPDPCRPMAPMIKCCPKICCPTPGCCIVQCCGNPNRPTQKCAPECQRNSILIARPIHDPCCPLPKNRDCCCQPPRPNSFNPTCIVVDTPPPVPKCNCPCSLTISMG